MNKLIDRLNLLSLRYKRFVFDLRGNCLVYTGVVAAYEEEGHIAGFVDLAAVIGHALEHDGIVGAWKDRNGGNVHFASCRLFTDQDSAVRFAHQQHQPTVYNLNRELDVPVALPAFIAASATRAEMAGWNTLVTGLAQPAS